MSELISRTKPSRLARTIAPALLLLLAAAPAGAAGGQLNLIPDPTQLFVMVVGFALLVFPVNAILFQPLFRTLDARADEIEGARGRAEKLEATAAELLERYESAVRSERETAETGRRQHLDAAREEQSQITQAAREEAEREIEHARGELASSLEQARVSLRASAKQLAGEAAERVLGRSVS